MERGGDDNNHEDDVEGPFVLLDGADDGFVGLDAVHRYTHKKRQSKSAFVPK